jgi:hypothetical protein
VFVCVHNAQTLKLETASRYRPRMMSVRPPCTRPGNLRTGDNVAGDRMGSSRLERGTEVHECGKDWASQMHMSMPYPTL